MAKRKKLSPLEQVVADLGKTVSGGSKKVARKVATPKVTPPKTRALQDRGAAVRTFGPLARQPTASERLSAKSDQLARKRARLKRKRLSGKKHKIDPTAKAIRRGTRSIDDALRLLETPEELPDYYRKTMRPKTVRALERHVARQPKIEEAEREALRKTKVKSTFEDIVEELPAVKLAKGIAGTKRLVLDPAAKWAGKELKEKGVKLPVGSGAVGLPMAARTAKPGGAKIDAGVLVRGAKDLAGLPVDVPAGLYKVGEAGYKAVPIPGLKKSDLSGVKEIAEGAWEHDPYILLGRGKGKEAARELNKHPGLAALEAWGVGAGASRAAALGARATTVGTKGAAIGGRVGSRKRAPKVLPHTRVKVRQEYSRGLAGQTVQKRKERKASEEAKALYKESMRARRSGDRETAGRKYREATERNPFRLTETVDPRGPLQRRVDNREHVAEMRRRKHRAEAMKKVEELVPKKHRDIALLIGANIVQPTKESLRAYATHLKKKEKGLGPAKQIANVQLRQQIEEALDDPKLDLEALEKAAREYGRLTGGLGRDLVERGILDAKAEEMAKLVPVLASPKEAGGMGGRLDEKESRTPAGEREFTTRQLRQRAERELLGARGAEAKPSRAYAQALANARVSTARQKRSPALREAERGLRAEQASLARTRRATVGAARSEGGSRVIAQRASAKADRTILRLDESYRKTENRLRSLNQQKAQARKRLRNTERAPSLYSAAERAKAEAKVRTLEERSGVTNEALQVRRKYLYELADEATTKVASGVKATGELKVAAQLGRIPTAQLGRFERARAREGELRSAVTGAKARLAAAERVVASERNRIRGVAPPQADRLLRAIAARDAAQKNAQLARQRYERAREAHIGAKRSGVGKEKREAGAFRDDAGAKITAPMVKGHLRSTGRDPDEAAFFSQMPFTSASSAFYQGHFSQPKGVSSKRKTGKATDEGSFGLTDETARESVARGTGLKSLFDEYVEELGEFGRRSGKDLEKHSTKAGANQRVADLAARGQDWVAVPLKPLFGKASHASELYRRANEPDILDLEGGELSPREGLTQAMKGGEGQGGTEYALVPKFVADRFVKHIEATKTSSGGRLWRETNRLFRGAVLATSPSWVLGNITEASFRAAVKGAGPGSYKLGKNAIRRLEEIDPVAAEELLIRLGQGHLGMQELQAVHVVVSSFDNSSKAIRNAVGFGAKARRARGINAVANGWKTYTHHVFDKNGLLEQQFKVALLGRRLKRELKGVHSLLPDAKELRTMDRAIDDLARGLRGTDAQVQMTEWVTRAYGRYEAFGPAGRKFISQYTPFAAWYVNAVNFVFHVMPQDHPVLTGFIAANHRATEEWRHEVGLDIAPSWLKGALPVPGGFRPLSRYTPFGAFQDPLETPIKLFLPSVSGLMMNARGLDWRGEPLNDKKSPEDVKDGERLAEMGKTLLSSFMPIFGQVKRGVEKEGSILSRAGEVLNPVRKQDFDVVQQRAFNRLDEIETELKDMPTLEEAGEGTKVWLERTKLNAERTRLWGTVFKGSKGKYGTAPAAAASSGPPSFGGGAGPAGPKFGGGGAVAGPKFGGS